MSDTIIKNAVLTVELYRFQINHTVVIKPPSDHPAVLALLQWNLEQAWQRARESTDPPSLGPISP